MWRPTLGICEHEFLRWGIAGLLTIDWLLYVFLSLGLDVYTEQVRSRPSLVWFREFRLQPLGTE